MKQHTLFAITGLLLLIQLNASATKPLAKENARYQKVHEKIETLVYKRPITEEEFIKLQILRLKEIAIINRITGWDKKVQ